jgi:hypothetical protein
MFAFAAMHYDHFVGAPMPANRMKLSPRVTPMDSPSIGFFLPKIRGQSTFSINVSTNTPLQ